MKLDWASELALDWAAGWTRTFPEDPANLSYCRFLPYALFTACKANCFTSPSLFTAHCSEVGRAPKLGGWIFFCRFTCQLSDTTLHRFSHWTPTPGEHFLGLPWISPKLQGTRPHSVQQRISSCLWTMQMTSLVPPRTWGAEEWTGSFSPWKRLS